MNKIIMSRFKFSIIFKRRSYVHMKKLLSLGLFGFIFINILYLIGLKKEFKITGLENNFYKPKFERNISDEDCYASVPSNSFIDLNLNSKDKESIKNVCSDKIDWLIINDNAIVIYNYDYLIKSQIIINKCKYSTIEWHLDDFNYKLNDFIEIKNGSKLDTSKEFFYIICDYSYENQKWPFSYEYKTLHARIFSDQQQESNDKQPINVFLLGFDSVSKNYWLNNLPLSSSYLNNHLKAEVLNRYNIVGDGTPANLIPLLCSINEEDLPNTIKNTENSNYVNEVYPFIWNNFTEYLNYSSLFAEDWPSIGTFQYRMKGMSKPPTRHYMRPVQLFIENEDLDKDCINGRSLLRFNLDYANDFMNKYKSTGFFGFMFLNYYSHDTQDKLSLMDGEIFNFLTRFNNQKAIRDNTILIILSDHGPRFGSNRESIRGLLNERNPFFSIYIPELFKKRYKNEYDNFMNNKIQLLTPMDIHKTFLDLINLELKKDILNGKNKYISPSAISLFDTINYNRTCQDANIDNHWCSCLKRTKLVLDEYLIQAALLFTDYINNNLLKNHLNMCHELHLDQILNVYLIDSHISKNKQTKKKINQDINTQFNLLTEPEVKIDYEEYFFQIKTIPNNAIYEFTMTNELNYLNKHKIKTPLDFVSNIKINKDKISRINMYGNQSDCIKNDYPDLRKYCYCI